jgi:hypothetical protein
MFQILVFFQNMLEGKSHIKKEKQSFLIEHLNFDSDDFLVLRTFLSHFQYETFLNISAHKVC